MKDILIELLKLAVTLAILVLAGMFIDRQIRKWLKAAVTGFVEWAELEVQGSKMGAEKKALVIVKLKESGITVNSYVDKLIDTIVTAMNAKRASLADETQTKANEAVGAVVDALKTEE